MNTVYAANKNQLKQAYVNWLSTFDSKYHLTLIFPNNTNEYWTRRLLNRTLIHLNKAIYKNRYRTGKSFIEGVAVREYVPSMASDHYHIMMVDREGWLPEPDRMNDLVGKQIRYVNRGSPRNIIKDYRLQDYYNEGDDGLEGYITKQFDYPEHPWDKVHDSIGLLSHEQVLFGRLRFDEIEKM